MPSTLGGLILAGPRLLNADLKENCREEMIKRRAIIEEFFDDEDLDNVPDNLKDWIKGLDQNYSSLNWLIGDSTDSIIEDFFHNWHFDTEMLEHHAILMNNTRIISLDEDLECEVHDGTGIYRNFLRIIILGAGEILGVE